MGHDFAPFSHVKSAAVVQHSLLWLKTGAHVRQSSEGDKGGNIHLKMKQARTEAGLLLHQRFRGRAFGLYMMMK